ncbi:MAG: hypothetical protein KH295_12145 [Clostridiaceae bacterium]|nr:hypothetical protein [Clostridiaceae bacterium]
MSFSDHKITQFTHRISELADQPNMPADELKARFDACPEELRQSLNAVCDDAARLEARVEGIVVDTFGDTIDKEMLSDELAAELDAKATQTEVDTKMNKADLYLGTYTGDGVYPREINLGFAPRLVYVMRADGMTGSTYYTYHFLAIPVEQPTDKDYCLLTQNGFQLRQEDQHGLLNSNENRYIYLALK